MATILPLPSSEPVLQRMQHPLPEPIIRRIVDFTLLDPDATKIVQKTDGTSTIKPWQATIVNLSMIDKATRVYARRYRFEKLDMGRYMAYEHNRYLFYDCLDRAMKLMTVDWHHILGSGTYLWIKSIVYTEQPEWPQRPFLDTDYTRSVQILEPFWIRLWDHIANCPKLKVIEGVLIYPAFFSKGYVFHQRDNPISFLHVLHITIPLQPPKGLPFARAAHPHRRLLGG